MAGVGTFGRASDEGAVVAFRDNYSLLKRLLHKNRQQHRRGRYFKELDMLRKAISRYLVRRSFNSNQINDDAAKTSPGTEEGMTSSSGGRGGVGGEGALLLKQRSVLVNCKQLQRVNLLVARCASSLTSLISRTHFLAFSFAMLSILARIRLLVAQILSDNVHQYNNNNNNSSNGNGNADRDGKIRSAAFLHPEFLQLQLGHRPYPKVLCHWSDGPADEEAKEEEEEEGAFGFRAEAQALAKDAGAAAAAEETNKTKRQSIAASGFVDFGEQVLGDWDLMEEDFEEEKGKLPVVDDQDITVETSKKDSEDFTSSHSRRQFRDGKMKKKQQQQSSRGGHNRQRGKQSRKRERERENASKAADARTSSYQKMFDREEERQTEVEGAAVQLEEAPAPSSTDKPEKKEKKRDDALPPNRSIPVSVSPAALSVEESEKTKNSRMAFISVGESSKSAASGKTLSLPSQHKLFRPHSTSGGGGFAGMRVQGGSRDSQQEMDDIFSQLGKKKKKKKRVA